MAPNAPDVAAAVAESRARCGLPAKVLDPTALRSLAALFVTGGEVAKTMSNSRTGHRNRAAA